MSFRTPRLLMLNSDMLGLLQNLVDPHDSDSGWCWWSQRLTLFARYTWNSIVCTEPLLFRCPQGHQLGTSLGSHLIHFAWEFHEKSMTKCFFHGRYSFSGSGLFTCMTLLYPLNSTHGNGFSHSELMHRERNTRACQPAVKHMNYTFCSQGRLYIMSVLKCAKIII